MNECSSAPVRWVVSRLGCCVAATIITLASIAVPARAAEEDADAIRTWIRDISLSPQWVAGFNRVESFGRDTQVTGLRFRSIPSGVTLTFDDLTFSGRVRLEDGAISATGIESDRFEIAAANVAATLSDVVLVDGTLPNLAAFTLVDDDPLAVIGDVYRLLAEISMREGSLGPFELLQSAEGVDSLTTYEGAEFTGWEDGGIARFDIGTMRSETPSPDGDIRITIAGLTGTDYDIAALADLFEPSPDEGFGPWKTTVGRVVYDNMALEFPDGAMTITSIISEDLDVRAGPRSIGEAFNVLLEAEETAEENPAPVLRALGEIFGMVRVGRIEMEGFDIVATGIDEFRLDRMTLRDASAEFIGEYSFDGMAVVIPDEGFFQMERLAWGRIVPPQSDAWIDAVIAADSDLPVDVSAVLPQIGLFEIAGLDTETNDSPPVTLDRLRIELDDYFGPLPTVMAIDVDGLRAEIPEELEIPSPAGGPSLAEYGYDEIDADLTLRARWLPDAGTLAIDRFDFSMRDMGTISLEMALGGIDASIIDNLEAMPEQLAAMTLESAAIGFRDDSIVGRVFAQQAGELGVEPDAFRQQMVGALPFMLSFVGTPDFQQQIVPILQSFLSEPEEINVSLQPPEPVPLMGIQGLVLLSPQAIPEILGVVLSSGDASSDLRDTITPDETVEPEDDDGADTAPPAGDSTGAAGGADAEAEDDGDPPTEDVSEPVEPAETAPPAETPPPADPEPPTEPEAAPPASDDDAGAASADNGSSDQSGETDETKQF